MIKDILVPASGSDTDQSVFATALALARPCSAHLRFLHVHLTSAAAALGVPQVAFCQGRTIAQVLQSLRVQGTRLSVAARSHFEAFCAANRVAVRDAAGANEVVTASWQEEVDEPDTRLTFHARHCDLVVVGRRHYRDHFPGGLIEHLVMHSGRPVVIAGDAPSDGIGGTIVVGWKETAEAARAVTAAIPLLRRARRVVLVGIAEGDATLQEGLDDLAQSLAWHEIDAEVEVVSAPSARAAVLLPHTAAELNAALLVVGAFGRAQLSEYVFGGVTDELIRRAAIPVFMVH